MRDLTPETLDTPRNVGFSSLENWGNVLKSMNYVYL